MKKIFIGLLICCFLQPVCSQVKTQKITSEILEQDRLIRVYVPESYKLDSTKIYPLSIILDAEDLFDIYVANSKLLAKKQEAPEQIIVGIVQIESRIDDTSYDPDSSMLSPTAQDFKNFLELELLQYIDDNYRLSPFKVIVGRSLTANFINYFFIQNKPLFNAFINLNPSYADNMARFINNKVPRVTLPTYYYMSSGSYNSKSKNDRIEDMNGLLETYKNPFIKSKLDIFNEMTYTNSIGLGIPSALAHVFKMYGPITKQEYANSISKMTPPEAIGYLEKKYVEIEYFFGTNISIRQKDILRIEPLIIDTNDGDYLNEFGKMILRIYPNSALGYYYIGLYYETGNYFKKAIKYYKLGYEKIDVNDPNRDAFYNNIERVMRKKEGEND